MAFLCLFDCWYGCRDQQKDPAPSLVLLPPYLRGPVLRMITRRNFLLGDEIITMAYAFMMKAVVVR